jgi:hypothetical protein
MDRQGVRVGMSTFRILFVGALLFASAAEAQTRTESYMLQERCGKRSDEIFRTEYGTHSKKTEHGELRFNYESHYSERLNKCFFLEDATSYSVVDGKSSIMKIVRLFDANGNKEYANFSFGACIVDGKTCRSYEKFLERIKQYMEN